MPNSGRGEHLVWAAALTVFREGDLVAARALPSNCAELASLAGLRARRAFVGLACCNGSILTITLLRRRSGNSS